MTTTQGEITASQTWRCLACHRPLGYLIRRARRHTLIIIDPGTLAPRAEIIAGTVFCECGAARPFYPDETRRKKQKGNLYKIDT